MDDVTLIFDCEAELAHALQEWQSAGAPVMDIIQALSNLIAAHVASAQPKGV